MSKTKEQARVPRKPKIEKTVPPPPPPQPEEQEQKPVKLQNWRSLAQEVELPAGVGAAVFTRRPQLLAAVSCVMNEVEVKQLLNLIGVLIDTNQALQEHCMDLSAQAGKVQQEIVEFRTRLIAIGDLQTPMGLLRMDVAKLADYARFNEPEVKDGEDDG